MVIFYNFRREFFRWWGQIRTIILSFFLALLFSQPLFAKRKISNILLLNKETRYTIDQTCAWTGMISSNYLMYKNNNLGLGILTTLGLGLTAHQVIQKKYIFLGKPIITLTRFSTMVYTVGRIYKDKEAKFSAICFSISWFFR